MTAALPPWDPDEYDREVRASRQRERQQRDHTHTPGSEGQVTVNYAGRCPRGRLTDEELQRRMAMDKALGRRSRRSAKPREKSNGKWVAQVIHEGRTYVKTFDTYEQAEQFIEQIKRGGRL